MRRAASGTLIASVALSGAAGVVIALLLRPRQGSSIGPSGAAANPSPGKPGPSKGDGDAAPSDPAEATADLDRAIVAGLDKTVPGTLRSYDLLRRWVVEEPEAVRASYAAYSQAVSKWLEAQVAKGHLADEQARAAREIVEGYNTAGKIINLAAPVVGKLVQAASGIPGIGSVIQGLFDLARLFEQAAIEAAKEGRSFFSSPTLSSAEPIFSGYRDGVFWFWDTPVWSLTAPMWASVFSTATGGTAPQAMLEGFVSLATQFPFGYAVPFIRIENDGAFRYRFNQLGTGDIGAEAIARREVWTLDVWNPIDVTPTGPRGFDPAHPLDWKQPGEKRNRLDAVYSATGGL